MCSSLKFISEVSHLKCRSTVKGGCIPSKNKLKTHKLRWLESDIDFKLLRNRYPIAHASTFGQIQQRGPKAAG